ncbi:MAG: phosphatidate cytidylyltransferase [Bacteroidales bacterium]|nr:phosphatidate cytidylyltransferase [Bacteroidales bacterium]
MNNLLKRILSGAIYAGLLISSSIAGMYVFGGVMLAFSILGLIEYSKLISGKGRHPDLFLLVPASVLLFFSVFLFTSGVLDERILVLTFFSVFAIFAGCLFRRGNPSFSCISLGIAGLVYIPLPLALTGMFFTTETEDSYRLVIAFLVLIWSNDSFAYLTGKVLGKHKLLKRVSPGKTIEGSAGGLLITLAMAYFLNDFLPVMNRYEWMGFAAVIVFFGTFGDLIESLLKRSAGVKDSGALIPGHGGVLDRIDSILIAGPAALGYLVLVVK